MSKSQRVAGTERAGSPRGSVAARSGRDRGRPAQARESRRGGAGDEVVVPAARWLVWSSFALALAGLAVSVYLTIDHFASIAPLACPENSAINCVKVTTSEYSKLAGVPVALLGLLYYVAMVVLFSPWVWRSGNRSLALVRTVAAGAGVAFVFYLIWAELFRIQAICLWCTAVHVITFALFAVVVIGQALRNAAVFAGPSA